MKFSPPYSLAFDLGTTGCKGLLVDSEGAIVGNMTKDYPSLTRKGGYLEQDPRVWWEAIKQITSTLLKGTEVKDLAGIGFCGTIAVALPVNQSGTPLRNAILYADMRSIKQYKKLKAQFEEDLYQHTGNPPSPVYSLTKWMWIKENEPKIFKDTFKILQPKDFILAKLTDKIVTDYASASATMAFHIKTKTWVDEVLEFAGIPVDKLPETSESISIMGELTRKSAQELGLKRGIPVIVGAGDTAALLVGTGAVKNGRATAYLGAAAEINLTTDKPLLDPKGMLPVRHHAIPNLWFNSASAMTSGTALRWFLENFGERMDSYSRMDKEAAKIAPGTGGAIFLPYLSGERLPIWDPKARGAFIGLSMTSSKPALYRAILEGVAFSLRSIMELYTKMGVNFKEMTISGGGAKSELWKRIVVDVLEVACSDLMYPEEVSVLGVAALINMALDRNKRIMEITDKYVNVKEVLQPDKAKSMPYNTLYKIYCRCYPALAEIMHDLVDYANM